MRSRTDRTFRQQFTDVWRWMEWPGRSGADIGIDLVARDADGRLIAIQCKCYDPDSTLTKHDIGSFVALSGQQQWPRRIIVATTDHWATNAEKALEGHVVPVERIGIDDLDAMTVDWLSVVPSIRLVRRAGRDENGSLPVSSTSPLGMRRRCVIRPSWGCRREAPIPGQGGLARQGRRAAGSKMPSGS